jgi:hypothetical protein
MKKAGHSSIDRRRVDDRGRRRTPVAIPGIRDVPFAAVGKQVNASFKYLRAQIEHLPGPKVRWSRSGQMKDLLYGFVISTEQLYSSTISVMADTRPKQIVLAGGVLARAVLEGVCNLFALLEDPTVAPGLFLRDDFLTTHLRVEYRKRRFKRDDAKEVAKLHNYGDHLGLSAAEIKDPEGKKDPKVRLSQWPTPGKLLKRTKTPQIQGERRLVFKELHGFWYSSLSALSHHRVAALQMAVYTEEQPDEATFLMAKSATASLALVAALSVLSEVEVALGIAPSPSLRAAWGLVRDIDELSQAVHDLRYEKLLGLPPRAPGGATAASP